MAAEDKDPNALIEENVPKLLDSSNSTREQALSTLLHHLQTAYNKRRYPTDANKRSLSAGLIRLYQNNKYSPTGLGRRDLIQGITRYGENEIAKPFVLKLLNDGPQVERDAALAVLGAPGGVSGPEFYDKVADLAKRGLINAEGRTTMLARVDKARALAEVIHGVETASDKTQFLYSAWALQDYYRRPEDFKLILPRIKEFGLTGTNSFRGGDGTFWVDADLLAQYTSSAKGKELEIALEIMESNSSLCKPVTVPTLIRALKDAAPKNRTLAARALKKAWGFGEADKAVIKTSLQAALEKETDAETRKTLLNVLRRMGLAEEIQRKQRVPI